MIYDKDNLLLSVVIPAYNEEKTVVDVVRKVLETPFEKEVVVIDDGSTDRTADRVRELADDRVRLIAHERNQGKGAALSTGFSAVQGDIVIVQDADLEYDPGSYTELLGPLTDGRADVVYGSRFLGEGARPVLHFWHCTGNKLLTLWSNMWSDLNLSDMETCYKVFRREVLSDLELKERRFGVEPEITQKLARRRWRIFEVPVSYCGRSYEEGKKIGIRDAFRALWCVVRYAVRD